MKRTPKTPEQRQTEKDALKSTLSSAVTHLMAQLQAGNSQAFQRFLDFSRQFHTYSMRNQLLIFQQCPEATLVLPYSKWADFGRHVKKGEKGLQICVPRTTRKGEGEGEARVYFSTGHVFDVSQTEGEPLPRPEVANGEPTVTLDELVACSGLKLALAEDLSSEGLTNGHVVVLNSRTLTTQAQLISVFLHEWAHALLHFGERRDLLSHGEKELEAEAVAYLVGQQLGVDSTVAAADYILSYGGDGQKLQQSLEHILQASRTILSLVQSSQAEQPNAAD